MPSCTEQNFAWTLPLGPDGEEFDCILDIDYDWEPYVPAVLYGDYPQPAEGGGVLLTEVRIVSVPDADELDQQLAGTVIELDRHNTALLEEYIAEHLLPE